MHVVKRVLFASLVERDVRTAAAVATRAIANLLRGDVCLTDLVFTAVCILCRDVIKFDVIITDFYLMSPR